MQRFDGEICGLGTVSGVRVVIGRWVRTPFGAFADAMVEHPDGHRRLIAPSAEIGAFIAGIYGFDDVLVADVTASRSDDRLNFSGGPLVAEAVVGRRDALGWALRVVPRRLAASVTWARLVDPIARLTMDGVRTSGRTDHALETYGATDRHRVASVTATWDGQPLGALADVSPPVRFGFSSTPRRPSMVAVCTTIRPLNS